MAPKRGTETFFTRLIYLSQMSPMSPKDLDLSLGEHSVLFGYLDKKGVSPAITIICFISDL